MSNSSVPCWLLINNLIEVQSMKNYKLFVSLIVLRTMRPNWMKILKIFIPGLSPQGGDDDEVKEIDIFGWWNV